MGIISDIVEANKERVGQLLSALPSHLPETPFGAMAALGCPICSDLLTNEEALQRHILDRHRHLHVYAKLNGCVLPDVSFTDSPITELTAVLLGDSTGTLALLLDDLPGSDFSITPGKPINIVRHIPRHYVGRMQIRITIGKTLREFVVYCRTQPSLNIEELDRAIWRLQLPLLEATEPTWASFQQEYLHDGTRNNLEQRYLAGFYSYVLGCYLEIQRSPHAAKHLEEALGKLRPFASPLAHTARCALALKLNAFGLLKECGPASRFYESNQFFNTDLIAPVREQLRTTNPAGEGLWVDDFLEQLLGAISDFMARKFDLVEMALLRMRKSPYFDEPNNWGKVTLLQARTANALDRRDAAKKAYTQLAHHPLFGREAERYCEQTV